MPTATYDKIQTYTAPSAQTSVTFSTISSAYTDLILVGNFVQSASTAFGSLSLRFNGDTAGNYSYTGLQGSGSGSGSSFRASNSTQMDMASQNVIGNQNIIIQIQNYSNTTTNKTAISRYNNPNGLVMSYVGLWRNTAAISSLVFFPASQSFATGSIFTLYGIKAA
jgi:hypothetical protein